MDEKKEKVNSLEEEALESTLDKTNEYKEEQLNDELEKLAEVFRDELKKVKEQGAELTDEEIEKIVTDKSGEVISPEDLCQCCGERRRDKTVSEGYPYCEECRELMKRYPISIASVIIAVVVIFVGIVSVATFVTDFVGYNKAALAKEADRDNKKFSAVSYYDDAISFFDEKDIVPKKLLKDSAYNVFTTLPNGVASLSDTAERIESALNEFEAKFPIYKSYVDLRDTALVMYKSFNAFYATLNEIEYEEFDSENEEQLKEIYDEIGRLVNTQDTIKALDGSGMITVNYDKAAILFSQFMFAYSYDQFELAYAALTELSEVAPEYVTIYGYELAIVELQYGNYDKALALAEKILQNNAEDSSAYIVYSYNSRMQGKYDKAIEFADKGIELQASNPDLYRQKAIALMLKGEYDAAIGVIEEGLSYEEYGVLYYTYLVAATEANNKTALEKVNNALKMMNADTPERIQDYLDGKLTCEELFTEGTGDIE